MLGSINVLIRRILMTDSESTVTYTKNSYFICKTKCETNRAYWHHDMDTFPKL